MDRFHRVIIDLLLLLAAFVLLLLIVEFVMFG